jgi:5-keto-L-gluconate epimerase
MKNKPCLSIAVSEEHLGDNAPVLFQEGIIDGMRRAAELGYTGVETHVRNPAALDGSAIRAAADELGISVSAVGTGLEYSLNGLCFTSPDAAVRGKIAECFRDHIDLARELSAVVFVGLCRGTAPNFSSKDEYLELFAKEILPVQEYADQAGVILVLEPIASYMTNLLNTTEECLEFIARPGLGKMELLLDTHHMFLEDRDMYDVFGSCADKIGHLHISDSNRRFPEGGNIDFDRVAQKLKEIGYSRAVSLEVLPYPTGLEAARRGIEWMKRFW